VARRRGFAAGMDGMDVSGGFFFLAIVKSLLAIV
jgi:hypothetical protein